MPNTFTWCPAPGPTRVSSPRIATTSYGDGYVHRAQIGINPRQDRWSVSFVNKESVIDAIDTFIADNCVAGFWWKPPGEATEIFVIVNEWSVQWLDKMEDDVLVGTLTAEFIRAYNLQPGV